MQLLRKIYIDQSMATIKIEIKQYEEYVHINKNRIINIEEEIYSWRKASHIHKFFVDNVQEGVDNCDKYYVEQSVLLDLRNRCELILKDNSVAKNILPTWEGFFFGNTEYDNWYFNEIEDTKTMLDELIKQSWFKDSEFYYSSSW